MSIIFKVKTVSQLLEASKKYLLGLGSPTLTNWNEGSRLRIITLTVATMVNQIMQDFYSALKKAVAIAVYEGFGFDKKAGVYSSGRIRFTRDDPATEEITILTGTSITLDGITYTTIEDVIIEVGNTQSTTDALSQAETTTPDANIDANAIDTASGKGFFSVKPQGVDNAINPAAFSGGTSEETDEQRRSRFNSYILGLTTSSVEGLKSAALSVDGVVSASVRERVPEPGTNTIYIDDGSGTTSTAIKNEVQKVIDGDRNDRENYPGARAAGIKTIVVSPTAVGIDIEIEVRVLEGNFSDFSELEEEIKNEVIRKINTLPLGYDVTKSLIVEATRGVNSFIYDVIVVAPSTNQVAEDDEIIRYNSSSNTFTITFTEVSP